MTPRDQAVALVDQFKMDWYSDVSRERIVGEIGRVIIAAQLAAYEAAARLADDEAENASRREKAANHAGDSRLGLIHNVVCTSLRALAHDLRALAGKAAP